MFDNNEMLRTAAKVFELYDLPDGATVSGATDKVEISYAWGSYDAPEMEMLVKALNEWKKVSGGRYVVFHPTKIDGVPVRIVASIPEDAYYA